MNIQFNVFLFGIFTGLSRCHIVLEDITKTKKCLPLSSDRTLSGLPLGHFKVFLATLAQFHAAGIAWWHNQQLLHQSATLGIQKYIFVLVPAIRVAAQCMLSYTHVAMDLRY